jgi:Protein of unknown function (DUF2799)
MTRRLAFLLPVVLAACATIDKPTPENLAQYCTAENAYLLGSQSRAYLGVCPKASEAQFLQGLARGRAIRPSTPEVEPYYLAMAQAEQQLLAATSDSERQQLRARLQDLEWWALHLLRNNGTYTMS